MEFLSFLRALSLEPVNDSVIAKMIDSVNFQGNRISATELGPELTEALTRLLSDDQMDYENVDGSTGEGNGNEVTLFGNIKLPEIKTKRYLPRRLDHNVVLLTKSGLGWRAMERELVRRMRESQSDGDDKMGDLGRREMFAVSWAASCNGSGSGPANGVRRSHHNNNNGEFGQNSEEDDGDELFKASDLIKWGNKPENRNIRHFDNLDDDCMEVDEDSNHSSINDDNDDDDVNMEVDKKRYKSRKLEKDVKIFLDPWVQPPRNAKLRLVELDEIENPDAQFNSLCSTAKLFTVHWVQAFRNDGFIWKKTHGPLKISRLQLNTISYQEGKWFPFLEHKAWQNLICIRGVAGMGKSTFLASMAHELKQKYKSRLVCFINLKRLSSFIESMNLKSLDILKFSELILRYFGIESDLEQSIFKCLMSTLEGNRMEPKVELLMDGIDTMSKKARHLLVNFLKDELSLCDKWSYRVWLTTRPHTAFEIEDAFSIVAYDLDHLDSSDARLYITYSNEYVNSRLYANMCRIPEIIFSSSLKAYLKIDLGKLVGVPERLVAFDEYMVGNNFPNLFQLDANKIMRELVRNVKACYIKNCLEMDPTDNESNMDIANAILWKHIPLAIKACSGDNKEQQHNCTTGSNSSEEEEMNPKEEAEILEFGIVTKNKQGKLYFIHPAYPAYILAEYYYSVVPDDNFQSDFFINYVLSKDACDLIRQFYDDMLSEGAATNILAEWMDLIRNFLIKTYHLSNSMFDHERVHSTTSVLHLCIIDQRLRLAKLLLLSFAPHHRIECQRLITRKVKVLINDVRQYVKDNKIKYPNTANIPQTNEKNGKISKLIKYKRATAQRYVELSALSLAIMFGDMELLHMMYKLLGNEGGKPHMSHFGKTDNFHFTPLHLAVIGCNEETFVYLTRFRQISTNTLDIDGHFPIHLLFFNRWVLTFPSHQLGNPDVESAVLREVHICKYYDDLLDPEYDDRVGKQQDRAGNVPLLSSGFVTGYTKMQMKECCNFSYKGNNKPWKICYYRCFETYVELAKSLSGRTMINFLDKVEGIYALVPPPFHLACAAGYIPLIETMLEKQVRLNVRDKHNRTALFTALCKEQMHVVQYLLERGIDRDLSQRINGIPLLHHLSVQNRSKSISYLVQELDVPVDLRAKDVLDNCTPLSMACIGGCLDAAETLIELGADVNARDDEQLSPLLQATHPSSICNLSLVKLLLLKGADVNASCGSDGGQTCLHYAASKGNLPLVQCLLKHAKEMIEVDALTHMNQSALHIACKKPGNLKILEALVIAGAKVELPDILAQTPLFVFGEENYTDEEMGLYLIDQGASVYKVSSLGCSLIRQLHKKNPELGNKLQQVWKAKKLLEVQIQVERQMNKK